MVGTLPDVPHAAHWARRPTPEERAAQLAREERLDRRAIRGAFVTLARYYVFGSDEGWW